MNVIYNCWPHAQPELLKRFYMVVRFTSYKEEFIGEMQLILFVKDREEAENVLVSIRRSLTNLGLFKLLGQITLTEISSDSSLVVAKHKINNAAMARKDVSIFFETLIGATRPSEVQRFELRKFIEKEERILTTVDVIVKKIDEKFLLQLPLIKIDRSYQQIPSSLFNLHRVQSLWTRRKPKAGTTITGTLENIVKWEQMLGIIGLKFCSYHYRIEMDDFGEIIIMPQHSLPDILTESDISS